MQFFSPLLITDLHESKGSKCSNGIWLLFTPFQLSFRSYYPFWEGKVCIESLPVYNLSAIDMTESGTVRKVTGWTFVSGDKPIRVSLFCSVDYYNLFKSVWA